MKRPGVLLCVMLLALTASLTATVGSHGIPISPANVAHVERLQGHDEVMTVAFSPDGTLLASGGYDHQLYLWGVSR